MGRAKKRYSGDIFESVKPEFDKTILRTRIGCLVQPYKHKQSPLLEQNTGQYDQVYHKYVEYVGFTIPYNGSLCYATYNRDYDFLVRALPEYDIDDREYNKVKFFTRKVSVTGIETFNQAQSELIMAIDKSISERQEHIWFIHLQTSGGKTLLATYYATLFNMKTIVLCFSDSILKQWEETFKMKTTMYGNRCVRLTGRLMDQILAGEVNPKWIDVYFATPTLLDRWANDRQDYKRISDFFDKAGIGFMIYDEAHRNVSSIVRLTSVVNPRYQMYLSADFGQGEHRKEVQFKSIFKDVPVLEPTEDLMRTMKYTKLVVVEYNTHPSPIEKEEPFNRYGYDATLFMKYEFKKGIVQNTIVHIIKKFMDPEKNHRMLILFMNIEHVEKMYADFKERFPEFKVGRYYADLNPSEKQQTKDSADIIIATYGSFSTGLDTHNIKYVVSCNQCNKVQDNQAAGRSRPLPDGSDSIYFLLVDMGFAYCRSKLKTRLHYLQDTKSKDSRAYHYSYNVDVHAGEYIEDFAKKELAELEELRIKREEEQARIAKEKEEKKKAKKKGRKKKEDESISDNIYDTNGSEGSRTDILAKAFHR